MARYLAKACTDRQHDIERWEVELAVAASDKEGDHIAQLDRQDHIAQLDRQIAEARRIIADSGY
jgi:hypothetical protein